MDTAKIEAGAALILEGLGCDLNDQNFEDTPRRFARSLVQVFRPQREQAWTTFDEGYTDFVLLRDHEIWTFCPHHLLPVRMEVSIGYIPSGRVIGLSKLVRVLHETNRGPMLQEAFTHRSLELLLQLTGAESGACLVKGEHGCMRLRGVRTHGDVITRRYTGQFLTDPRMQNQFMHMLNGIGRHA
jgi:GTP cyclohydrolase I